MIVPGPLEVDPIHAAYQQWIDAGWGDAADGMATVTSVIRAQQILMARVDEVLRPLGLTFARFELLMLLRFSRTGRLPMSKASTRLQVHPASVTNAADRLEAAGLVQRTPHPSDGRTTLIELTPTGRTVVENAATALNEHVFSVPGISNTAARELVAVLTGLRREAGDFNATAKSFD
nr:MarR family transcriptional regulator [Smaragdicoccus niigatensis]